MSACVWLVGTGYVNDVVQQLFLLSYIEMLQMPTTWLLNHLNLSIQLLSSCSYDVRNACSHQFKRVRKERQIVECAL